MKLNSCLQAKQKQTKQELNAAMEEFCLGKSLATQRRDIVIGRHCVPRHWEFCLGMCVLKL